MSVCFTTYPDFGFLLNGQLYPNNSVVTLTDIGDIFNGPALFCLTPSTECCSATETPNEATATREWYLPDGTVLPAITSFSREQVSSAVSLYRNGAASPTGVFRCDVPDASETSQSIYVGLYLLTDGNLFISKKCITYIKIPYDHQCAGFPSITSLIFDRNSTTLMCTSTGGPPTTVTWRRNGVLVNDSLYQQSQRVMNTQTATYENVLFSNDITNFVDTFSCDVGNVRSTAEDTVELNGQSASYSVFCSSGKLNCLVTGVFIIRDQFKLGQSATATCESDTPATRIEWLTNGEEVIQSALSTQELDLVFPLVNDSIHNEVYTCRVTREGGMIATQNFTVNVDGKVYNPDSL